MFKQNNETKIDRGQITKRSRVATTVILIFMATVITFAGCVAFSQNPADINNDDRIVIGTFDSRAVAIAFVGCSLNEELLVEKANQMRKAKAAGDTDKMNELEKWGSDMQKKRHLQGFGTAPVDDLLEYIEKDIPQIAQATGVDMIVSKWDIVWQNKNIEIVDITEDIAKAYNPKEKAWKSIRMLKKYKPLDEQRILSHEH